MAFESKKLVGAQLKWPTHKKELFALINCLKAWQHYLGFHKTKVFTDNVSLRYFETQPKAMAKELHWHDTLALMDMKLIHKLGKSIMVPYALSCKEEY
jgi:hypothetical protein